MIVFHNSLDFLYTEIVQNKKVGKKNTHLWSQKSGQRFLGVIIDVGTGYIDVFNL